VSIAIVISAVSVVIAFASLVLNVLLNHRASVRARKPVLVFLDDPEQGCWVLQNVGNGPALNVLVAQRESGEWFNPVRGRPLAKDATFALVWLGRTNTSGLGASYSDFEDRRYTSTLGGEVARAYEGERLPTWASSEIKRYWQLSKPVSDFDRWAEKRSDFSA
jgi:hypothetical protein